MTKKIEKIAVIGTGVIGTGWIGVLCTGAENKAEGGQPEQSD